jgi:SNF2 family DNA or RNA helicase
MEPDQQNSVNKKIFSSEILEFIGIKLTGIVVLIMDKSLDLLLSTVTKYRYEVELEDDSYALQLEIGTDFRLEDLLFSLNNRKKLQI